MTHEIAAPPVAKSKIETDISSAHIVLENNRRTADDRRGQAARNSSLWATNAVTIGQNLSHGVQTDDGPGKPLPAAGTPVRAVASESDKTKLSLADQKNLPVVTKRENIAQFQSRLLYGALALSDAQWRQVNRMLAAVYQEGYARKLNQEARPQADTDAWQQQRSDLSCRAFAEVKARLTPEQSAQFCKLYQRADWLWTMGSGAGFQPAGSSERFLTASVR